MLQHAPVWDVFITNLTAPPAQHASHLPPPPTVQPQIPADCLNEPLDEVEAGLQNPQWQVGWLQFRAAARCQALSDP